MTTFNLHIPIIPCRILAGILSVVALQGCDTVVEATMPITPSSIPQASTEVFKQKYPAVSSFVFEPLEKDKTWQTEFVTSVGKVLSVVDYQGEIIDLNSLVGIPKNLPEAIKQHFISQYPSAEILAVYDLMKSPMLTEGYKLVIKTANNTTLHLYYDSANAFVRAQTLSNEKALSIIFTSTDQINYDTQVPLVVKQFVSNNQLKNASVVIYQLTDKSYKLFVNFRDLVNGALQTFEIVLSETGLVLEWASSIENNYAYKVLNSANISSKTKSYLQANFPNWQFDYGIVKTIFGQNKTSFVALKVGQTDSYLLAEEQTNEHNLTIVHTQVLAENKLPVAIKSTLSSTFPNWIFVNARVIYQATDANTINTAPNHFLVEIKQGNFRYAVRFDADGKIIYQYHII
ncbi:hypothetical protein [Flectobacillus roseus]|uniref:Uncharacterized protein n=1 Tax=Flectobacillus roseus TaxID=502259 RepID=A0ABT6YEI5_9BACT|nr:hypothetical protein [Flectobacillus roseus]MDI9862007.1 hypothetical protein [Flectobacillus roseus]